MPPHIAVIGAGIAGVTTAYALSQQGYDVTVIDRQRYAGMETSFANGGQLSASNAEVWNQWSTVLKGLAWMLRNDAPLLVNLSPDWHKYSWFAEFIWNIQHYRANTVETTRLAIAARQELFAMAEREGIGFDLERRGILHVYRTQAEFERARDVNALLVEGGLDRRAVAGEEIRSIEPAIQSSYYAGLYTPSDCTGDIHKFTRGLAKACEKRGVRFRYETATEGIQQRRNKIAMKTAALVEAGGNVLYADHLEFDGVVLCAGIDTRALARTLGDRVNIYPVKGYSITVNLADDASRHAAPWVSLLDDEAKIVTSRLGADRFRVAGTAEFNGPNRDIRADRIVPLVNWVRRLFPSLDTDSVVPWSGLRPMMPNMMPAVRCSRTARVFYNSGHGHLGWTLSGATAQMVASLVSRSIPKTNT
ncbi:MAG: D-amino acid dehydrogenase [Pseudolabrys sp.]|nr:D-amino acid dehydrogenase [Pseudolabrys sp.]